MITNSLMIVKLVLEEHNWAYCKCKNFIVDIQRKSDFKDKSFKTNAKSSQDNNIQTK